MPIYEYECPTCGEHFERVQRFNEPPASLCPRGHTGVRRVLRPASVIFKGSGFYTTDYQSKSEKTGSTTRFET